MTNQQERCPACGAFIQQHDHPENTAPAAAPPPQQEERERDHRGVLLPRRTRIGGIIMPQ